MLRRVLRSIGTLLLIAGCGREGAGGGAEAAAPRFKLLSPRETGVTFANTITTSDSLNAQVEIYVYNGGGVAVGDLNNDGLPDIFFAGNQVSSRLYLNRGNMRFEDVTERAGVATHGWATGVSLVDINGDGWLDIYVCITGAETSRPADRANLLFINNRDGTFTEEAARYGIADSGFSTQAVFLDYDRDGDLDLFLLNNSPREFARGGMALEPAARAPIPENFNKLYRNNGNGTFTDVSQQAGIRRDIGYGLAAAVGDIDGDGWPDIYVSNDIEPNDVLYINQHDGTFKDEAARRLKHTSYAGMGVDIADFNDDGRPDILQVDMMPPDLAGRQRMSGFLNYSNLEEWRLNGLRVDYDLNALQLNDGRVFSEISRMAGVAYTDWSWAALFADFDNDGRKDIFITNGYPKAVNDLDYQMAVYRARRAGHVDRALQLLHDLRGYPATNYLFQNNGDLTFTDRTAAWGMTQPGYHYGAAYADLNNDGKLDLVVNNIDAPASIYENVGRDTTHWLDVALHGTAPNVEAVGASVVLSAAGRKQYLYHSPYRGYTSSMEGPLHFGLGAATTVDTLAVTWPDGVVQVQTHVRVDTTVVITRDRGDGRGPIRPSRPSPLSPLPSFQVFQGLNYKDPAPTDVDFEIQPLLPDQPSRQGPPIATADVNGDGLEDVFVGNTLYMQLSNGTFAATWRTEPDYQNWGAAFFDANGDGKPDLYVASGGYALSPISRLLQDRLYINQGGGRFTRDSTALPPMLTSTMVVAPGPEWLFVGGRLTPRNYPYPTRSYLLKNDGHGHFSDVTAEVAPALAGNFGMVTAAVWIDFDGDGKVDLVTAGEWMPLRFFRNTGGHLIEVTQSTGLPPLTGLWSSLAVGDFNRDGRPDLVAGNRGLNFTFTEPPGRLGIYAGHLSGAQATDVIRTLQVGDREYPLAGLAVLGKSIYTVGLKYPTYAAYATADIHQLFGDAELLGALHYRADTLASLYLENLGNGRFRATPLPMLAQVSTIRGIVVTDVNGDGNPDLIVAGNLYDTEANTPRADASNGLWLAGDGHGHFNAVPSATSGLFAPLDVTGLALVKRPAGSTVLVANVGDSLSAFTIRRP